LEHERCKNTCNRKIACYENLVSFKGSRGTGYKFVLGEDGKACIEYHGIASLFRLGWSTVGKIVLEFGIGHL